MVEVMAPRADTLALPENFAELGAATITLAPHSMEYRPPIGLYLSGLPQQLPEGSIRNLYRELALRSPTLASLPMTFVLQPGRSQQRNQVGLLAHEAFADAALVSNVMMEILGSQAATLPAGCGVESVRVLLPTSFGDLRMRLATEVRSALQDAAADVVNPRGTGGGAAPPLAPAADPGGAEGLGAGGAVVAGNGGRAAADREEAEAAVGLAEPEAGEMDPAALSMQLEPLQARVQAATSGLDGHQCVICAETVRTGNQVAILSCNHVYHAVCAAGLGGSAWGGWWCACCWGRDGGWWPGGRSRGGSGAGW